MPDSEPDFLEEIREKLTVAEDKFKKQQAVVAAAQALVGTARLSDTGISVQVGAGGKVSDLKLGKEALRLSPTELGDRLVRAIRTAEADFGRQYEQLAEDMLGTGELGQEAKRVIHDSFPPVDEEEGPAPKPSSCDLDPDDDDDDGPWRGPILRS